MQEKRRLNHPFGELLKQYRRRKPGLSQERLAHRIGYDEAVLVRMSQGKKDLTGPSGRDRVIRLIEILRDEGTMHTLDEANALLAAAQLPPLYAGIPVERTLIQTLRPATESASVLNLQPSTIRYTLPASVSSFIGREHEIADLAHGLQAARLITLTGSGGSGKTRLALEAGAQRADAFAHGACFIGLAPVRHADEVVPAIAKALDVLESPGMPLLDSVKRFLANKSVLLVLDNFEHVLDSATVVSELLMAAPKVKVLATSREPLRLTGEQVFIVEPLELGSAITLFTDRARSVKPGFQVNDAITPIVADICRRMDCLPLAIELAAARVRQFSAAALLTNLTEQRSLSVLIDAPRDVPARHQTLHNAIAWSYNLLSVPEQQVLRTLGAFVGGAEIEQIAFVSEAQSARENLTSQPSLSTNLQSLVDKNLVRVVEQSDGTLRYLLLELIREFALEQLRQQGHLSATQRSHAEAFLTLAREGMWAIRSHAQLYWHERLERDYPNFREALTWSFDAAGDGLGDALIGCQLVEALMYFWFIATRYLAETRAWILKARVAKKPDMPPSVLGGVYTCKIINGHLWSFEEWVEVGREALVHFGAAQDVPGIALAKYSLGAGLLGINPHDEEGLHVIYECLALSRESGNAWMESHALHVIGIHAMDMNELVEAETLHREMVAIRRRMGNVVEISMGLWQLAGVLTRLRRFDEANEYLRESAALAQQVDSPQDVLQAERQHGDNLRALGDLDGAVHILEQCIVLARNRLPTGDVVGPLISLSRAEAERGNPARAYALLSELVQIIRSLNWSVGTQRQVYRDVVDVFAIVAIARGDAECSARLWGAVDASWESHVVPRPPDKILEVAPHVTKARAALGDEAYAAAYAQGRATTLEQAIEYALVA